jgi:hypothetical protein
VKAFRAWRFKCDFCGKNMRQRRAMERHESGCTANVNRVCRMHSYVTREDFPTVPTVLEMGTMLREHYADDDHGLSALRSLADDCPCCILAALRHTGLCKGDEENPPLISEAQFNFKEEMKEIWANHFSASREASY